MRDPHLNTVDGVRPFEFDKFGQMWTADFMHGPKLYEGKKKHKSYLHVIIDDCSRYVVSGRFYPSESAQSLIIELMSAIRRHGIAHRLYTDNGSAYNSRHLKIVCANLSMQQPHTSACPDCHRKQSNKNKKCKCGANLDTARKTQRIKYWIAYRVGGKLCRESVEAMEGLKGNSIEDARAALSKRTVQKRENRIMDILPESKMTFSQLTKWYLELEKVKALSSFWLIELTLKKFNAVFGDVVVGDIKLADLQNYQARRLAAGKAPATVDHEIRKTKTMIIAAFDNDMVSGRVLKVFKRCKPTLKKGSDVRDRILSRAEYDGIMENSPRHAKPVFATGYWTGMRRGEIVGLTWDKVDMKGRVIKLEAADTKDNEPRIVPICKPLYEILKDVPRAIHDEHVFLYRGKPMNDIRRALTKACKNAGVVYGRFKKDGFIFHDLRHNFNTNMRKAGVSESVIMAITGHSTREMFDRYNTVDLEDAQKAVHQLDVFLENVHQNVHQVASDDKK